MGTSMLAVPYAFRLSTALANHRQQAHYFHSIGGELISTQAPAQQPSFERCIPSRAFLRDEQDDASVCASIYTQTTEQPWRTRCKC